MKDYGQGLRSRIREAMAALPRVEFDAICPLLGDNNQSVFIVDGRTTAILTGILSTHPTLLRPDVFRISQNREFGLNAVQQLRRREARLRFDFRRRRALLEAPAQKDAEYAQRRIVLFTAEWWSPIVKNGRHGTARATSVVHVALVEAVVVRASENIWPAAQNRIEVCDRPRRDSFSQTGSPKGS